MRIFPEGAVEWLEPLGKTFCILSAFAVVVGFAVFLRQYYIWHHWPTAQGAVVESQLVRSQNDEGVTLCSAAYRVQYPVDGQLYTAEQKESSSSNDCQAWKNKVDSAKGAPTRGANLHLLGSVVRCRGKSISFCGRGDRSGEVCWAG